MPEVAAWLIIGLPLIAFAVIALVIRPFIRGAFGLAGLVAIGGIGGALALSIWALASTLGHGEPIGFAPHSWFVIGDPSTGNGFEMTLGVLVDPLTAIMLIVVSGVSLLVQTYSLGYMRSPGHQPGEPPSAESGKKEPDGHGEHGHEGAYVEYPRYFAYMSLFTASMLGLVLARNLIQLFVFWELVGLCSYLLIGFWWHRPSAAAAAKKAFIVTRIGDFGFLLAILYLYFHRTQFTDHGLNPFDIPDILSAAEAGFLSAGLVTWAALGIFAGAVGKSAQFPLHTWLPDAMEGPTPVSSLIHAATMVAAGVFLIVRMFPLFAESPAALNVVAIIGGFTAVFAASMGLASNDIKRVLAYSTVSQLGYMVLAVGVGAPAVAMFHLFNHAFFKCLLFLDSGSVHHSVHTFDMRYMGGLRKTMPLTYVTTLIAALSLAGIFPLAGFWSKDEILAVAWSGAHAGSTGISQLVFWLALAAAFMTAFYIFRLVYMTFHGDFRGGIDAVPASERIPDEAHLHVHHHESPLVMIAPMVVLAVASVVSGFVANATASIGPLPAHWFSHFLHEDGPDFNFAIASVSTLIALAGIGLATLLYKTRSLSLDPLDGLLRPVQSILARRFYMDDLYEGLFVNRSLYRGLFRFSDWLDRRIVDGFVDLVGWLGRNSGRAVAQLQTGQVQAYGVGISMGAVVLLLAYLAQR